MSEPVKYIERTREYYLAQGYKKPYQWAHFEDVPFTKLSKPLSESRVALISTSDVAVAKEDGSGHDKSQEDLHGFAYTIPTNTPVERLFSRQEHYDKYATNLDDVNSYFPVTRLQEKIKQGRIESLAPRCHGVFTSYSQNQTTDIDAPEVLRRCKEDNVDLAVLTPVCPVCHQTISLVARHLEANGIPTVVIASAKDIVEHCGVPRLVHVDFPLGNPCGVPFDEAMQSKVLDLALDLFESAVAPRTTVAAPFVWPKGDQWKNTIFTEEQPFLEGDAYDHWMEIKAKYREDKLKKKQQS